MRSATAYTLIVAVTLLLSNCGGPTAEQRGQKGLLAWQSDQTCRKGPPDADECLEHAVSIVRLIATPEQFDRKVVWVAGYIVLDFEGRGLFLSESDYVHGLTKNSIWVGRFATDVKASAPGADMRHKCYVLIRGTFDASGNGHMGAYSGAIDQVDLVMPLGGKACEPVAAEPR